MEMRKVLHSVLWICHLFWTVTSELGGMTSDPDFPDTAKEQLPLETVLKARCYARCKRLYDVQQAKRLSYGVDRVFCSSSGCRKCLQGCEMDSISQGRCQTSCSDDSKSYPCTKSCMFLKSIGDSKIEQSTDTEDSVTQLATEPSLVCQYIPNLQKSCDTSVMYIKWDASQSGVPSQAVYIVKYRRLLDNNTTSDWTILSVVSSPIAEVTGLRCATMYRFQVYEVMDNGDMAVSRPSSWFRTSGITSSTVSYLNVIGWTRSIVNNKPIVTINWDYGPESSCFYKIFWYAEDVKFSQAELEAPWDKSFRITGLSYSKNYTVQLSSYDEKFSTVFAEDKVYIDTPNCLDATSYNHTLCAPLEPNNLSVSVLTPGHENRSVRFINVSLTWEPPINTDDGNDVVKYHLFYRKEPPSSDAHRLKPDKGTREITNGSGLQINLYNLHNHNFYRFELAAETLGGIGNKAIFKQYLEMDSNFDERIGIKVVTTTTSPVVLSQETKHAESREELETSELIAVILAPIGLFAILTTIVCFVLVRRRIKYKPYTPPRSLGAMEELNPIYDTSCSIGAIHCDSQQNESIENDGYEIDYSCLDFISVVGEGAFGKVVKAEYYPKTTDGRSKEGRIVAVKMLRDFYTGDESRSFVLEIQAMKNLGHHPYIVSIIGCCLSGPKLCLVMDYCALGDLRNHLRKYREKFMSNMYSGYGMMARTPTCFMQNQVFLSENKRNSTGGNIDIEDIGDISEAQLLSYARQITMGMEFLEQRKFVHRDLAARNILLFDHRHIKISDFGLTRDVYETNVYQPTSARKLPYKWMAIESLFIQRFTIKSDVWSFGIVLWEIVTLGGSPYPSIPLKDLYGLLNDGYRMEKPENCSSKVYQIMLSCWHPNPDDRPNFTQVRCDLEKLLEETRSYIDLSVEVSEDFFNDSINDSSLLEYNSQDHIPQPTDKGPDTHSCDTYLESKNLCVDIHTDKHRDSAQNDSNTQDPTVLTNTESDDITNPIDREQMDNTDIELNLSTLSDSGTEMDSQTDLLTAEGSLQLKHVSNDPVHIVDNQLTLCEDCENSIDETEIALKNHRHDENCASCEMKRTKSSTGSLEDRKSITTTVKDSLRNILLALNSGSPKLIRKCANTTKKCVSYTDISELDKFHTSIV